MDTGASEPEPSPQEATLDGFVQWALRENVTIRGICPKYVPHRGLGVITTRPIKAAEVVLRVPIALFHTLDTVDPSVRFAISPAVSLHGLLAADLAVGGFSRWGDDGGASWASLAPDLESFRRAMPWFWPPELRAMLPAHARRLAERQAAAFARDWRMCRAAFPRGDGDGDHDDHDDNDLLPDEDAYLRAWLLVNSRSFYYSTPTMEHLPHLDRLVLMPVADLFNHAGGAGGAQVQFDDAEYTFTADRDYAAGEEMCIEYTEHSNDYLLAEYGFIVPPGDEGAPKGFSVEDVLPRRLSPQQLAQLHAANGPDGIGAARVTPVCHQPPRRVVVHVAGMLTAAGGPGPGGPDSFLVVDGELKSNPRAESLVLAGLLGDLVEHADEMLGRLEQYASQDFHAQRGTLIQRWQQIRDLASARLNAFRDLAPVP